MKSLNLQILPQHFFFYSVLSVGASLLIWTSRVPSPPAPPPAAAAASPPCMFSPHQYALQLLNVRATRTVRDGKKESGANIYDREAMSAHISHLTPSTASCWLFRGSVYFLAFLGGAIDGFTLDLKSVRLGCWLQGGELSAVAAFVLYNYKKEKGGCLLCTSFVNFASCPHWLSVRLCVAQKGQWSSHYFLLLSFLRSQGYCLGWLMRESRWCFLFFASAVISASMNRATCLLWRRRWINYLKDTTSDWGRTLEVCSAFIPQLYFWRHLQCCGQT